jgi:uncharacterized protein YrrD
VTESFAAAKDRKVVSRATAESLGAVSHMMIDKARRRVVAIVIHEKRQRYIVDWKNVTGFGSDAVIIKSEDSLREPANDQEQAAVDGKLELIGKRTLSESGTEQGSIVDVEFDPDTGKLDALLIAEDRLPATDLLGVGSYAAVLKQSRSEA